jgi:predicted kinase
MLILVTGVPGSGKTTLGSALASQLNAPFLCLDAIKEELHAGNGRLTGLDLRIAAEVTLEKCLAQAAETVVLDIWIQPGRDTDRIAEMLRRQGRTVVEALCRVPAPIAVQRYRSRDREPPHLPADEETLARIRAGVEEVTPLGVGTSVELDTSEPVDAKAVLALLTSSYPVQATGSRTAAASCHEADSDARPKAPAAINRSATETSSGNSSRCTETTRPDGLRRR